MYNRYCSNCNGYIQHKNLKKCCRLCIDINKDTKARDTPNSEDLRGDGPREHDVRRETPTQPIIIEDKRIISRTVQINLHLLYEYFYQKYNITEEVEDIFNLWLKYTTAAAKGYKP